MIFTLMKNRRLRLQVFVVWLVLGVGILPDKTSALKCYSCDGPGCKTNFTATAKEVNCATSYCEKITDGDTLKMQCSSEGKEGECIKKEFPDGCYAFSEENKEKLTNCTGAADAGVTAGKERVETCSCDSDLCNNNEVDAFSTEPWWKALTGPWIDPKILLDANPNTIKCYSCSSESKNGSLPQCGNKKSEWKEEECKGGACHTYKMENGTVFVRGCDNRLNDALMKCFKRDGGCYKIRNGFGKISECLSNSSNKHFPSFDGRSRSLPFPENNLEAMKCLCDTNLCNFGERPGSSDKLILLLGILAASYGSLTRL